jgi:hypothetical protein
MVETPLLTQELMSDDERRQRQDAAKLALGREQNRNPYWAKEAQINTVGYLTTATGAMTAGYAVGWLTGRFTTPFERLQMNFVAKFLDVTDNIQRKRDGCVCNHIRGWADQGNADALISAPDHWPKPERVEY